MKDNKNRPVFLNLLRIHMPVGAVVSITHRLSGIVLALLIPVSTYFLELSLRDAQGYQQLQRVLESGVAKAAVIIAVLGLVHHLLSGIRVLLIDIDIGAQRHSGRRGAWLVAAGDAVTVLLLVGMLL